MLYFIFSTFLYDDMIKYFCTSEKHVYIIFEINVIFLSNFLNN